MSNAAQTPILSQNMSSELITVGWNERMETAFQRMRERKIRHLPVSNEAGEIVGMLSDRDVQRAMSSTIERELFSPVASERLRFDPFAKVRDYMSWPVLAVAKETDLKAVAERMVAEKVSALLVHDNGRVAGIVTAEDLLRVLADLLADPKSPERWSLQSLLANTLV